MSDEQNSKGCENCAKIAELKGKLANCEKALKEAERKIKERDDQEGRDQFAYCQH